MKKLSILSGWKQLRKLLMPKDSMPNFYVFVPSTLSIQPNLSVAYLLNQGTEDILMDGPQQVVGNRGLKEFYETLERMAEIHDKKSADYAEVSNPLSNFDVTTFLLTLFNNPRDQTFVWPIATKLARLATLLNSGNTPNNESIEDSLIDIANYVILWKCDLAKRKE